MRVRSWPGNSIAPCACKTSGIQGLSKLNSKTIDISDSAEVLRTTEIRLTVYLKNNISREMLFVNFYCATKEVI